MKNIFLSLILFGFINVHGQLNDSLEKMERQRQFNESFFGNMPSIVLPDFTAKDLNGIIYSGNSVRNGKVTFISFWFVSCTPCIAEIPNLNLLYQMTKDNPDVQFFSITWEKEAQAKEAVEKYNIQYPVLLTSDIDASTLTFGRGYPTNMVLDKNGKIRSILSGGSRDAGHEFEIYWKREISKILEGDTLMEVSKPMNLLNTNKTDIVFIDTLSKIQSLNDLTNYFKGQSLYIDLWASWCMPCREEFKSRSNSVDSFLNKHKITPIYVSIDKPKVEELWKNLVYEYQLTGFHLMAGWKLQEDLKKIIYKNKPAIDVPRYIIVKNGKIVEVNAFPPSQSQKLIKQLTEKLR